MNCFFSLKVQLSLILLVKQKENSKYMKNRLRIIHSSVLSHYIDKQPVLV